jgi:hypothetical protein
MPSARSPSPTGTIHWQAQAFIDTFDATAKTINIFGSGVWWGFILSAEVPEPSTCALVGLSVLALWVSRRPSLNSARQRKTSS